MGDNLRGDVPPPDQGFAGEFDSWSWQAFIGGMYYRWLPGGASGSMVLLSLQLGIIRCCWWYPRGVLVGMVVHVITVPFDPLLCFWLLCVCPFSSTCFSCSVRVLVFLLCSCSPACSSAFLLTLFFQLFSCRVFHRVFSTINNLVEPTCCAVTKALNLVEHVMITCQAPYLTPIPLRALTHTRESSANLSSDNTFELFTPHLSLGNAYLETHKRPVRVLCRQTFHAHPHPCL